MFYQFEFNFKINKNSFSLHFVLTRDYPRGVHYAALDPHVGNNPGLKKKTGGEETLGPSYVKNTMSKKCV